MLSYKLHGFQLLRDYAWFWQIQSQLAKFKIIKIVHIAIATVYKKPINSYTCPSIYSHAHLRRTLQPPMIPAGDCTLPVPS